MYVNRESQVTSTNAPYQIAIQCNVYKVQRKDEAAR